MDKQKKYKKNYGIPFFAMAFLAAAVFEFYYIMTEPYSEFMLIGIGIIMLIMSIGTFCISIYSTTC